MSDSTTQIFDMRQAVMNGKAPKGDEIPIAPSEPIYEAYSRYNERVAAARGLVNEQERASVMMDALLALQDDLARAGGMLVQLGEG